MGLLTIVLRQRFGDDAAGTAALQAAAQDINVKLADNLAAGMSLDATAEIPLVPLAPVDPPAGN